MPKLYYRLPNGKAFAHVSRSGTSTLAAHALKDHFPEKYDMWVEEDCHAPQWYLEESWSNRLPSGCLVMVRDPISRLKSLIARNSYKQELVDFALDYAKRTGSSTRKLSKHTSIVTMHHLMPIDYIADNDSHFIKFPKIREACDYLELRHDDSIHHNKQRGVVVDLSDSQKNKLKDAIGIWEALL